MYKTKENNLNKDNFLIFGLSASKELAENVAKKLDLELGKIKMDTFADEEILFNIETSVRGKKVFVIQSTNRPASQNLMELFIFVDALRRSSAKEINVIMPYYGYSRQDRKTQARQPITSALIARLLEESGVDRVISFDLHSTQIQGFFKIPFDELKLFGILAKEFKDLVSLDNFVVVSPDHGGINRARKFAHFLRLPLSVIDKRRDKDNNPIASNILGNVKGLNCVIYDDIVDRGGTIDEAYKLLKDNGAKDIYVICTHALLSPTNGRPDVVKSLQDLGIKKFISTNSVNVHETDFHKVVDLSEPIAGIIKTHIENESITEFFIKKYNTKLFT